MFRTLNSKKNQTKFLNSLDYWESLNLATVLLKADIGDEKAAYEKALSIATDQDELQYLLDKSIHSKLI